MSASPQNQTPKPEEEGIEVPAADTTASDDDVSLLHSKIHQLAEESARYKDQWVRSVAEAENTRKRLQRELEDNARYAVSNFAKDMVEVLENLSRASNSIPQDAVNSSDVLKTLNDGLSLTRQEMLRTLEKYGIQRIDPVGQKFDHNFHQAVVQIPRTDVPDGTVVQVVQAGYVIHDRLLRPAMVAVSKWMEPPEKVDTTA